MNKRNRIIFLINIFIISILIPKVVKGAYCDLDTFKTDKDSYYIDDNIIITALWELIYDPEYEISAIQIIICDYSGLLIWNSSRYGEIGEFQSNWTVFIQSLNLSYFFSSNIIYIKFVNIIIDCDSGDENEIIKGSISVVILKRKVSCELYGFNSSILYGDNLYFTAKFSDTLNNSDLINQTIDFQIHFNNLTIFDEKCKTNQSGYIELNISSLHHLNIGPNTLIFNMSDNDFYEDSEFIFDLYVEKLSVLTEIIRFDKNLKEFNDIEVIIYYYYYFSNNLYPLINTEIQVQLFQNNKLIISTCYETDDSGILFLNFSSESFYLTQKSNKIILQFTYNGTNILNNKTFNLYLDIGLNQNIGGLDIIQVILVFTISSIGATLSLSSFYIYNKRRSKFKDLSDLTVKI
ncbi:MAG: hypothetical protein ACFFA8_05535 [Promethearchaeota archaeon]